MREGKNSVQIILNLFTNLFNLFVVSLTNWSPFLPSCHTPTYAKALCNATQVSRQCTYHIQIKTQVWCDYTSIVPFKFTRLRRCLTFFEAADFQFPLDLKLSRLFTLVHVKLTFKVVVSKCSPFTHKANRDLASRTIHWYKSPILRWLPCSIFTIPRKIAAGKIVIGCEWLRGALSHNTQHYPSLLATQPPW